MSEDAHDICDLFNLEANRMSKTIVASYNGNWAWKNIPTMRSPYGIRAAWSSTLGNRALYTMIDTGAKHYYAGEQVKPTHPTGFVFAVWDKDKREILSVFPTEELAEATLRLLS